MALLVVTLTQAAKNFTSDVFAKRSDKWHHLLFLFRALLVFQTCTPLKTNMEADLPNLHFWVPCYFSGLYIGLLSVV